MLLDSPFITTEPDTNIVPFFTLRNFDLDLNDDYLIWTPYFLFLSVFTDVQKLHSLNDSSFSDIHLFSFYHSYPPFSPQWPNE